MAQQDNSTIIEKVRLRRRVLERCPAPPVVLETHGGFGRIYERTWFKAFRGVVIEKDDRKVEHLCRQRPRWAVYQGNSELVLEHGLARTTAFDVIDLDPYGQPFGVLAALSLPGRVFPDTWHLVVNDGGRQAAKRGQSWTIPGMTVAVAKFGRDGVYVNYLEAVKLIVDNFAAKIGFEVSHWEGRCVSADIAHYWAVLTRRRAADVPRETPQP